MIRILALCLSLFLSQSLCAQYWAQKHFDSLGITSYQLIYYVGKGLFKANDANGKYGYLDKDGSTVLPFNYDWLGYLSEDLIQAKKGKRQGYVDLSNKLIIDYKYKYTHPFQEGVAAVQKNKKFGFIDKTDLLIIPYKFDYAEGFSQGLAYVRVKNKYGYIDHTGEIVIPCAYDRANHFTQGSAVVGVRDPDLKMGLIDSKGNPLTGFIYDDIRELKGDKYIVEQESGFGIINVRGEGLVPCTHGMWGRGSKWEWIGSHGQRIYIDSLGNIVTDRDPDEFE